MQEGVSYEALKIPLFEEIEARRRLRNELLSTGDAKADKQAKDKVSKSVGDLCNQHEGLEDAAYEHQKSRRNEPESEDESCFIVDDKTRYETSRYDPTTSDLPPLDG